MSGKITRKQLSPALNSELDGIDMQLSDIMQDINYYIFLVKNKDQDRKFWDWTDAINTAVQNNTRVYFPKGLYGVYGILTIPDNVKLIGTKEGFTQAASSDTENGTDRIYNDSESKFLLYPTDMTNPTIQMGKNSVIKGIEIFYPNQLPTFTQVSELIQYPLTIDAKAGSGLINVALWGAIDFFKGTGERCFVFDVYGYNFGLGLHFKDASDIVYIKNVHLNPNVVRPVSAMCDFNISLNSIGIYLENVDGAYINNYHEMYYKKPVKFTGSSGVKSFILDNFWFDMNGLSLDINGDFGMGVFISNGYVINGYSTTNEGGLIQLNKDTSTLLTPVFINNVNCQIGTLKTGYTAPTNLITFNCQSGFIVKAENVYTYGYTNLVNNRYYHVLEGKIHEGSTLINLSTEKPLKNYLKNSFNFKQSQLTLKPFYWDAMDGEDLTFQYFPNGNLKIINNTALEAWKGMGQRVVNLSSGSYRFVIKADNYNSNSHLYAKTYNSDFSNPQEYSSNFDTNGIATLYINLNTTSIVDFKINAGANANDSIEVNYCLLAQCGESWKDYQPIQNKDEDYIYYSTSIPTAGTWTKGVDKVYNSNPTAGNPIGWVPTVSGSPGTWGSLGNII